MKWTWCGGDGDDDGGDDDEGNLMYHISKSICCK
jgi:hypothetical protein